MGIAKFEDIVAWQRARGLVREVYAVSLLEPLARDFGFRNQLQRAAVSTMSNIAEGFERRSPKENLHFLAIARASNAEVRSLLYVAQDVGYLSESEFNRLMNDATNVARLIAAFRASIGRYVDGISEEAVEYDAELQSETN